MKRLSPAAVVLAMTLGAAGSGIPDPGRMVDHHFGIYQFRRQRLTGIRRAQRLARKARNRRRNKRAHGWAV